MRELFLFYEITINQQVHRIRLTHPLDFVPSIKIFFPNSLEGNLKADLVTEHRLAEGPNLPV
jgi:hypothetical protein